MAATILVSHSSTFVAMAIHPWSSLAVHLAGG